MLRILDLYFIENMVCSVVKTMEVSVIKNIIRDRLKFLDYFKLNLVEELIKIILVVYCIKVE